MIRNAKLRDTIKINNQNYGDKYVEILSEGIKLDNEIKKCEL
jgi:hypothetical protein